MFQNQPIKFFYVADAVPDLTGAKWTVSTADTPPAPAPIVDTPPIEVPVVIDTPPVQIDTPPAQPVVDTPPAQPIIDTPPIQPVNILDELKKMNRADIIKAIGGDDFIAKAIEYYTETGNLNPYLEAHSVDFTKMSDEDIMRFDLQKKYPTLPKEDLELLYEEEIIDKYKLNREVYAAETNEARAALVKLRVEAQVLRDKNIESQKSFKAPERQIDPAIADLQKQQQLEIQNYQNAVKSDPVTTSFTQNKKVVLGDGENAYSLEISDTDVQKIVDSAVQTTSPWVDANGKPDMDRWIKVTAYALDPKGVEKKLIEHGITLGKMQAFKERANATDLDAVPAAGLKVEMTPAKAIATSGKMVPYKP